MPLSAVANKRAFLVVFFLALVVGPLLAGLFLQEKIVETAETIASLRSQEQTYLLSTKVSEALIRAYKAAFEEMRREKPQFAKDQVAFFSSVEQQLTDAGVEKISITTAGTNESGILSVTVQFQGSYYKVLHALAGWRSMPDVLRMKNLSLGLDPQGNVQGNTLLETALERGNP